MRQCNIDAACVAIRTADAYSANRYGPRAWIACAELLLRKGLTDEEAQAFLRSAHMRHAAESEPPTDADLAAYIKRQMPTSGELLAEARNLAETS